MSDIQVGDTICHDAPYEQCSCHEPPACLRCDCPHCDCDREDTECSTCLRCDCYPNANPYDDEDDEPAPEPTTTTPVTSTETTTPPAIDRAAEAIVREEGILDWDVLGESLRDYPRDLARAGLVAVDSTAAIVPTLDNLWCQDHIDYGDTDDDGEPYPCCVEARESHARTIFAAIRAALLGDGTQDAQNQAQDGRTAPAGTPAAPDPAERLGDALRRLAADHTTEWSQHGTVTRLADEVDRLEHQAEVGRRWDARARVLEQERDQAKAALERVRVLAESWRYKGEHGWGAWQEGEGPSPEDETLDHAAYEIRAALDGGTEAPPALTVERLTEAIAVSGQKHVLPYGQVNRRSPGIPYGWSNVGRARGLGRRQSCEHTDYDCFGICYSCGQQAEESVESYM